MEIMRWRPVNGLLYSFSLSPFHFGYLSTSAVISSTTSKEYWNLISTGKYEKRGKTEATYQNEYRRKNQPKWKISSSRMHQQQMTTASATATASLAFLITRVFKLNSFFLFFVCLIFAQHKNSMVSSKLSGNV